jgi:flagellar basal body-associated protein FliL
VKNLKRKPSVFSIIIILALFIIPLTLMMPSALFAQDEETSEEEAAIEAKPEPEELLFETTLPKIQAK